MNSRRLPDVIVCAHLHMHSGCAPLLSCGTTAVVAALVCAPRFGNKRRMYEMWYNYTMTSVFWKWCLCFLCILYLSTSRATSRPPKDCAGNLARPSDYTTSDHQWDTSSKSDQCASKSLEDNTSFRVFFSDPART